MRCAVRTARPVRGRLPRGDVWTEYVGTAVHDRFSAYESRLPDETVRALCNARLLRNLQKIVELEPEGWAARLQLEARDTSASRPAARCRSRSAGAAAATTWPWPGGRTGMPACSS